MRAPWCDHQEGADARGLASGQTLTPSGLIGSELLVRILRKKQFCVYADYMLLLENSVI